MSESRLLRFAGKNCESTAAARSVSNPCHTDCSQPDLCAYPSDLMHARRRSLAAGSPLDAAGAHRSSACKEHRKNLNHGGGHRSRRRL